MLYVVTGGSGSGKSEYAENLALSLGEGPRIYIATMIVWDEECKKKIERHRRLRRGKNFETLEQYQDLEQVRLEGGKPVALLECMSNLAANELYREQPDQDVPGKIMGGIHSLQSQCRHLVVVTNEVCSDGVLYDEGIRTYQQVLGRINREMAKLADEVTEVVYGIPVTHKSACSRRGETA